MQFIVATWCTFSVRGPLVSKFSKYTYILADTTLQSDGTGLPGVKSKRIRDLCRADVWVSFPTVRNDSEFKLELSRTVTACKVILFTE